MIDMQNVTKSYATGVQALNGVTLHIDKGEFVFIVGNSGSGKSTLIKLLLKELDPSSGTIKVNGINLNKMKAQAIPKYRRKLGVVFQDFRLLKDRSMKISRSPSGLSRPQARISARMCRRCCPWWDWRRSISHSRSSFPVASSSVWLWREPW